MLDQHIAQRRAVLNMGLVLEFNRKRSSVYPWNVWNVSRHSQRDFFSTPSYEHDIQAGSKLRYC
jgi:hypothetical protein